MRLSHNPIAPGTEAFFSPTLLTGSPGQRTRLTVVTDDGAGHNFSLLEEGIDVDLLPGESKTVEVTFPEVGAMMFFCKYPILSGQRELLAT